MRTTAQLELVENIAYPICILSIAIFLPLSVGMIWMESDNEILFKIAGSTGILAFGTAFALAATRAVKGTE